MMWATKLPVMMIVVLGLFLSRSAVGAMLFGDDFADAAAGKRWVLEHGATGSLSVAAGALRLDGNPGGARWRLSGAEFAGDFDLRVGMRYGRERDYAGVLLDIDGRRYFFGTTGDLKFAQVMGFDGVQYYPVAGLGDAGVVLHLEKRGDRITYRIDDKTIGVFSGCPTQAPVSLLLQSYRSDVEFDDLVISEPAAATVGAGTVNLLKNSSFEYSEAPNIPEWWGMAAWGLVGDTELADLDRLWSAWRRDSDPANVYDGTYSMRVAGYRMLSSCYFETRPKQTYTFSVYLKSEQPHLPLRFRYYNHNGSTTYHDAVATDQWSRFVWTLPAAESNYGQLLLEFDDPDGVVYVDAAQVEEGTRATAYVADDYIPGVASRHASQSELRLPQHNVVPVLDGVLDDPIWQQAAKIALQERSQGPLTEKTEGYLYFDENNIYIGVKVFDSRMADLRDTQTTPDAPVWNDDAIELFIGPSGPRGDWADYFHLGFNASGVRYDAKKDDPGWTREWEVKTRKLADRWEAEARLPFAMFDLTEFTRGDWTFNLCRENGKIMEYSAWSPTFGSFHKAENFGILKAFPEEITGRFLVQVHADTGGNEFVPTALTVDGKPFFGYGLALQSSRLPGEEFFRQMHNNELNLLVWAVRFRNHSAEELDQVFAWAEQYGVRIAAWLDYADLPHEERPAACRDAVKRFGRHRSIIAWMVVDEPHEYPDEVKACLAAARETDPSRPVFFNVTPHGLGMRIADLEGDLLMIDRYVFHFDGSTLRDIVPMMKRFQQETQSRPGWVFLQGMGYSMWVYRGPSPEEMTAQTYLTMIHGATSIVYFSGVSLRYDTWRQLRILAGEIRQITPILLAPEVIRVKSSNPNIDFSARKWNGKSYIVSVNKDADPAETVFEFPAAMAGVRDFFTGKEVTATPDRVKVEYAPYERKVLEISGFQD